jgi:hypothetical protein
MQVFIPTPLRPCAEGKDAIDVSAATIAEALDALTPAHPAVGFLTLNGGRITLRGGSVTVGVGIQFLAPWPHSTQNRDAGHNGGSGF